VGNIWDLWEKMKEDYINEKYAGEPPDMLFSNIDGDIEYGHILDQLGLNLECCRVTMLVAYTFDMA
jgi:DNA-directed RNA polymerase subunit N (RpoN/RPB10)